MRLPNGYGGIVNLGKKRRKPYAARLTTGWTDEGKAIYRYLGYYPTRKEALQALAEYNTHPYDLDGAKLTFSEVYEMWKERELNETTSKQKIASYTTAYKKCSAIYKLKITELKTPQMQAVMDSVTPRSKPTLNNIKKLFSQVSKFALENDYIKKSYAEFVKIENIKESKAKTDFSEEEINILWQHSNNDTVAIILILIYTGFRITELLELKTENIHLEENYCIGGKKTKAGTNRVVPIHHRIKPFFQRFYNSENETLFYINYPKFKQYFSEVISNLNIQPHTIHETRHTTASLMARYGADDICIKKILGHSNQDLTKDTYTHKNISDLISAIEVIP